jgi:hypothetical protein
VTKHGFRREVLTGGGIAEFVAPAASSFRGVQGGSRVERERGSFGRAAGTSRKGESAVPEVRVPAESSERSDGSGAGGSDEPDLEAARSAGGVADPGIDESCGDDGVAAPRRVAALPANLDM